MKPLNWAQWSKRCLALLVVAGATMPAINVLVDPFDLFETGVVPAGPYTNQRFHHTRNLLANPDRHNVLLLGTSIMGIVQPGTVEAIVPGARAYNAGFFLATASDLALLVRRLQAGNALPRNVVIGIDPYLFAPPPENLSYEFRFPWSVAGESQSTWWFDALFASSLSQSATKLIDVASPVPSIVFDFKSGSYTLPEAERFRQDNPQAHAAKVFKPLSAGHEPAFDPAQLNALVDLVRQLRESGVNVRCFIHPMNKVVLQSQSPQALLRSELIKSRLPLDLLDLSSMPGVSDAASYWYDMKHYRPEAAAIVLERVLAGYRGKAQGLVFQGLTRTTANASSSALSAGP